MSEWANARAQSLQGSTPDHRKPIARGVCYTPVQLGPGSGAPLGGSVEPERTAVLQAIEAETAAFFAKDYDAWADCWLHSEHVRRWSWYPTGGLTIEAGWSRLERADEAGYAGLPAVRFRWR